MNSFRRKMISGVAALGLLGLGALKILDDPLDELPETRRTPSSETPAVSSIPEPTSRDHQDSRRPGWGYMGSEACADCHAEIHHAYRAHPMSRSASIAGARPDDGPSDQPARFTVRGPTGSEMRFEYRVTQHEREMIHHEVALDVAGNEICSRKVQTHYAVGSGARGRSYFVDAGGQLYLSPMTWYAGAREWDLSPGYEKTNQHFERRVLDDCVFCHVGRAAPQPGRAHAFELEPILELGIGCERCHGPGRAHVSYHQSAEPRSETDPIVNPSRLSQPFRDDVCFQCHLQGLDRLTHPGRRPFDFRPGQAVADIWTVLITGTKISDDNTTSAVGQAEQMQASRCYIESQGAMSCTSCHDPHAVPVAADRVDFYRSRCLACHAAGDRDECRMERSARLLESSEDSCIQCHMPGLDANDVPHTSQTDHRVVRRPGVQPAADGKDEIAIYESDRIPPELVARSRAILLVHQSEELRFRLLAEQAIPLLTPWTTSHPDDVEALAALGTAYFFTQDAQTASVVLDQALAIDPDSEYALRQRMFLSHEIDDLEGGVRYGRRLIDLNPHHYDYHGRMAHMLGRAGRWDEAIESARKAVEIRPWSPQIHGWLAEAYRIAGQEELSEQHAELFEKLSAGAPSDSPP